MIYKTISKVRDLEQYGINVLTGESCAYGIRVLCDVNQQGKELIEEFLGGTVNIQDASNWNTAVDNKPSVGSIMLSRGTIQDLMVYILNRIHDFALVYECRGQFYGMNIRDRDFESRDDVTLITCASHHPQQNGRNIHTFTGRTV